jgi:hypothetical protein
MKIKSGRKGRTPMDLKSRAWDKDTALTVLACASMVGFGLWRLIVALQTGVIDARFHEISRADQPALFWFAFVFFLLVVLALGAMVITVCVTRLFGKGPGPVER